MASYSRKSTRNKALWGYLLLIAVLLSSSWFVYHEINLLVSIKAVEADMRLKRQEMSSALSALYRAETVGQSLVWGYVVLHRTLSSCPEAIVLSVC